MKNFFTAFLAAAALGGCIATVPKPKPACVLTAPPMLTDDDRIGVYGHKQVGPAQMLVIEDIPSVLRFNAFLQKSEEWKRATWESCKDPKAASLPAAKPKTDDEDGGVKLTPTGVRVDTILMERRIDEDE